MIAAVITAALGIGLLLGVLFFEVFCLTPGGLVPVGYLALFLDDPVRVGITLVAAWLTYLLVGWASGRILIYGQRQVLAMLLVGFAVGAIAETGAAAVSGQVFGGMNSVIGFIVPGIIALWYERQGVLTTTLSLLLVSSVTRLALIAIFGPDVQVVDDLRL